MKRIADIEFSGQLGLYTLWANTQAGNDFIFANVSYEDWQGSPQDGIAVEGHEHADTIAYNALSQGLLVALNSRLLTL